MCAQVRSSNLAAGTSPRPLARRVIILLGEEGLDCHAAGEESGKGRARLRSWLNPAPSTQPGRPRTTLLLMAPHQLCAPEGCPRCSPCRPWVRGVIGPTHGAGARGCFPLGRIPLAVRPREERAVSQGDFHLNAPWQNALRKLLTPRGKL